MAMRLKDYFLLIILVVLTVTTPRSVQAQISDELFIAETGHWIKGDFLLFYQSADDPLFYFGHPITDEYIDPISNQVTQYFQRARFDLIQSPYGKTVQLAPLGKLLYDDQPPQEPLTTKSPACRSFPDTNKSVCYAFLQFYDTHDGPTYFGNPISNLELREDRYVQYFERARLEWRPELPAGKRVALTDIGRIYFDNEIGDLDLLGPILSVNMPDPLLNLQLHAFIAKALIPANSQQTIFIIAQDQKLAPIDGVMVSATVKFPDGEIEVYRPPMTDAFGISRLTFSIGEIPPKEIVQVDVVADYQGAKIQTSCWFRIWY